MNEALFNKLRARARTGIAVEGVAIACATFVLFALVSFALDRTFRLEVAYRLVLMLLFVALLGRVLHVRLLSPLRVRLDDMEMALAVERAKPELRQALVSAVQFEESLSGSSAHSESAQLMQVVVDEVARTADAMDVGEAVDQRRTGRWAGLLLATAATAVAVVALAPEAAGLWFARNVTLASVEWPRATSLQFVSSSPTLRVPEGDDVTLTVAAGGVVPPQTLLHYAFGSGERGVQPMTLTGDNEFTLTLPSVLEDAVVYATGGDGQTPELAIEVVQRPRIEDLELSIEYPNYMKREPEPWTDPTGDLGIPRGGGLLVRARSSKPLVRAEWVFGEAASVRLEISGDALSFQGRFAPEESGVLTLHLLDQDKLGTSRPPKFRLRILDDREPNVRFTAQGVGSMITPIARIPGLLEVREDYGLSAVAAQYRVADEVRVSQGRRRTSDLARRRSTRTRRLRGGIEYLRIRGVLRSAPAPSGSRGRARRSAHQAGAVRHPSLLRDRQLRPGSAAARRQRSRRVSRGSAGQVVGGSVAATRRAAPRTRADPRRCARLSRRAARDSVARCGFAAGGAGAGKGIGPCPKTARDGASCRRFGGCVLPDPRRVPQQPPMGTEQRRPAARGDRVAVADAGCGGLPCFGRFRARVSGSWAMRI